MVRRHVLKVRLSADELQCLGAAVARHGGTRAGLTRRLLIDGLQALAPPASLAEVLAPFGPVDWHAAADALEAEFPERWG